MKEELDALIKAAVAIKPHVDALGDIRIKAESARKDLDSVNGQLEKLRDTVKAERNAHALEVHEAKKRHDEEVIARQNQLKFVLADIEKAKTELLLIQNETAKWHDKFEKLAKATNQLEKILA